MLLSKEINVVLNGKNQKYYKEKGYNIDSLKKCDNQYRMSIPNGTKLLVKIEDLPLQSNQKVLLQCDYCHKEYLKSYDNYNSSRLIIKKDSCKNCKHIKIKEVMFKKYGVDNAMSVDSIYNKFKNTMKDKYGSEHALQNNDLLLKSQNTCFEKYGVRHCMKKKIIKDKVKQTKLDKYGYVFMPSGKDNPRWNGGISSIRSSCEQLLIQWKKDSMKNCNYKCIVTGSRFDDIHHLYSFNKILEEALQYLNIKLKENIGQYKQEELDKIYKKCIELHSQYPLGVCLTHEIHNLFHQIYGYGGNTPEQFYEFQKRYQLGEFDYVL